VARADTEIYRRFRGTLRTGGSGCLALARTGIAAAAKRKLPLVILFAPPAIATVIFSFVVYVRFSLEAGATPAALGGPSPATAIASGFARTLIRVREQIVLFHLAMSAFALLVIAWFGAGLVAEDRRAGAHLLYFSRPLTCGGYLAAKFLTLLFYALAVTLVPSLVICTVAAFASPEWSFLAEEGGVVPASIGFGSLWAFVWTSVMLAISSLSSRKTFALVASFAFFMVSGAVSVLLANLQADDRYLMIGLQGNFQRVAGWMFGLRQVRLDWDVRWSLLWIVTITLLAWVILLVRVRRMEASA